MPPSLRNLRYEKVWVPNPDKARIQTLNERVNAYLCDSQLCGRGLAAMYLMYPETAVALAR